MKQIKEYTEKELQGQDMKLYSTGYKKTVGRKVKPDKIMDIGV